MASEDDKSELKKCWWCQGFYRGFLLNHVCPDGSTHTDRMSKPSREPMSYLNLTEYDVKLLKGMNVEVDLLKGD